jgi:hypothetical protein
MKAAVPQEAAKPETVQAINLETSRVANLATNLQTRVERVRDVS